MEPKFNNIQELKERLMPALRNRKRELKRQNIITTEEEIWNYFANNIWKKANDLSLAKMVDDILNEEVSFNKEQNSIIRG